MEKITYGSLGALGEDFHKGFERGLQEIKAKMGQEHPAFIDGSPCKGPAGKFADVSPADSRVVLGHFQVCDKEMVERALLSARKAFPAWRDMPWKDRLLIMRKAAELMTQRQFELAALLALEVGKNRFEAIAEVSEAIDLIVYYADQMESHKGFDLTMVSNGPEKTRTILKPYGAWAVVSPFNFPLALATGMAAAALMTGNTVVFKPASDTPYAGLCLYEILTAAGLPPGVLNFITGPGKIIGEELMINQLVDGFAFTGSRLVGRRILARFAAHQPKPCITEMGGKNPAIIMPSADLDAAIEGTCRSAFGMGGQKCSACSRVYVHTDIYDQFTAGLVERAKQCAIGDPAKKDTFLGPLINELALKNFEKAVRLAHKQGRVLHGGRTLTQSQYSHGFFVEPCLVDRLPADSALFEEELFAPLLAIHAVHSIEEAVQLANTSEYGLTAGIFTESAKERDHFFRNIEAGVVYCNRRGGATTGAWPGVQSFGGWKNSGSTGTNALGPYYLPQFMREQSQTIVK